MGIEVRGIDKSVFDLIFNQWYEPIRNFIYYKSGDIKLAEDLAQDTFLKIWEKKDNIKQDTIKSFLYTVANNLMMNRFDHQKVLFKFSNSYKNENIAVPADYELELKEFDEKLQKALMELDEKKRTVFLMNRIDEMTYKQIAENLGMSIKAIEKRMEKALDFLHKRISKNI